jgi:transposase-like protein
LQQQVHPERKSPVKKNTKFRRPRQPRGPRSSKRRANPQGELLGLREQLRETLVEHIRASVAAAAHALVEEEVLELVGAPWSRKGTSPLRRNGATTSTIYLDGEPCSLVRGRVRDRSRGSEVPLRTLQALASRDALDADVKRRLVRGISTRDYDDALGTLAEGWGLKKSAVSAAFVRASKKDLDLLNGRPLGEMTFVAVFLDGTFFADHTCLVALGITQDGKKVVLGVREGASENSELVKDLLADMKERGLTLTKRALFVLDGSKALGKAVRATFGEQAEIQRCILHKLRNVLSYLPPSWHAEARRRLKAAWGMTSHTEALKELRNVKTWLAGINESAATSLGEALEETVTVHRLGLIGALSKTLLTTNPVESAIEIVKHHARRVRRWNGAPMVLRWTASGLVRAERQFRRVKGHEKIPQLITALQNLSLNNSKDVA